MKPVRCPCCRLRIDGRHVWDNRNCAACGALFTISRHSFWTTYVLALVICSAVAYVIGHRGSAVMSLALLIVLPTFWGMMMINLRLFPADIKLVREGWTPGDSEEDQEIERMFESLRELDAVISAETPQFDRAEPDESSPGRLPLSTPPPRPASLEGIAIAIAFAALIAWHFYAALEPFFN
jgi:hypothetical protein